MTADSASSSEADEGDPRAAPQLDAKRSRRPALHSIQWGKAIESAEQIPESSSPRLAAIWGQQPTGSAECPAEADMPHAPVSPTASAMLSPESPTTPQGSHAASQNTLPRPHTAQAPRLPSLQAPPPELPKASGVPRSPGSAAAQGLNALLLSGGGSSGGSSASPTAKHQWPLEDLDPAPTQPLPDDFRPSNSLAQAPCDPAAIRAAAAELADKVMADGGSRQLDASPYAPAAQQPAHAPAARPDDNVLALKLTIVSGPSTDAAYVTAKDTRQVG